MTQTNIFPKSGSQLRKFQKFPAKPTLSICNLETIKIIIIFKENLDSRRHVYVYLCKLENCLEPSGINKRLSGPFWKYLHT